MSQQNYSQFRTCLLVLVLTPLAGFPQSILRGKVTDEKNGEPVAFANVFFSSTTMGSPTLEDGTFEIKNIPNGKYDLTISMVGYKRFHQAMEFQDGGYRLSIVLEQDPVNLSAVTVYADQADYKEYFPAFKKYFLGESENSVQCQIINPTEIHLYYDAIANVLTGHASHPIIVENKLLGYRIHYILDLFEFNFNTGWKTVRGIARFDELPPVHERRTRRWNRNRSLAYRGSLNHFMRSLYNNSVEKEGFGVSSVDSTNRAAYPSSVGPEYPIKLGEHISGTDVKSFRFKGIIRVEYLKEFEEWRYRDNRSFRGNYFQVSFMKFQNEEVRIYENGYYVDQRGVFLEGYLGWSETVGELLPQSYYLPEKK